MPLKMPALPLVPRSARGKSCALTLKQAFLDTQQMPQILHVVGAGPSELSMDFRILASCLAPGARVVFIGPHVLDSESKEELLGPEEMCGLVVSIFPHTYQRYLVQFPTAEDPHFVALFHPGLDIHFFSWYSCLRKWTDAEPAVPVLVTAYRMPDGIGETPEKVRWLVETLVGAYNGWGMWVFEPHNEFSADDGVFNSAYYVFLGSEGRLSPRPDDIYVPLYKALKDVGHPFAPRVGYLDVDDSGISTKPRPELLAAIAEGALRGAKATSDCTDELATSFACNVLDEVLGPNAGQLWRQSGYKRATCLNCGEGYDSAKWHAAICTAEGRAPLAAGDRVVVGKLRNPKERGGRGVLKYFDRDQQLWRVRMDTGETCLWSSANLDPDLEEPPRTAKLKCPATVQDSAGEPLRKAKLKGPPPATISSPHMAPVTSTPATVQDSAGEPPRKAKLKGPPPAAISSPHMAPVTSTPATVQDSAGEPPRTAKLKDPAPAAISSPHMAPVTSMPATVQDSAGDEMPKAVYSAVVASRVAAAELVAAQEAALSAAAASRAAAAEEAATEEAAVAAAAASRVAAADQAAKEEAALSAAAASRVAAEEEAATVEAARLAAAARRAAAAEEVATEEAALLAAATCRAVAEEEAAEEDACGRTAPRSARSTAWALRAAALELSACDEDPSAGSLREILSSVDPALVANKSLMQRLLDWKHG